MTFDREAARAAGVPVRRLDALVTVLTAVTIVLGMKVVGILLVSALLVIPAAAGLQPRSSFKGAVVGACRRRRASVVWRAGRRVFPRLAGFGNDRPDRFLIFGARSFLRRKRRRTSGSTAARPESAGLFDENDDLVLAFFLGPIQGRVGQADDLVGGLLLVAEIRRRRCEIVKWHDFLPVGHQLEIGGGGFLPDPLGDRGRVQTAGLGEDRPGIRRRRSGRRYPRRRTISWRSSAKDLRIRSPATWPNCVVEGLEIVQIDHQQAQRIAIPARPVDLLLQPGLDVGRIVETGQPVADGQGR